MDDLNSYEDQLRSALAKESREPQPQYLHAFLGVVMEYPKKLPRELISKALRLFSIPDPQDPAQRILEIDSTHVMTVLRKLGEYINDASYIPLVKKKTALEQYKSFLYQQRQALEEDGISDQAALPAIDFFIEKIQQSLIEIKKQMSPQREKIQNCMGLIRWMLELQPEELRTRPLIAGQNGKTPEARRLIGTLLTFSIESEQNFITVCKLLLAAGMDLKTLNSNPKSKDQELIEKLENLLSRAVEKVVSHKESDRKAEKKNRDIKLLLGVVQGGQTAPSPPLLPLEARSPRLYAGDVLTVLSNDISEYRAAHYAGASANEAAPSHPSRRIAYRLGIGPYIS